MPFSPADLAAKIAPRAASLANIKKEDFIHNLHSVPLRPVVRMAWPVFIDEIPTLAEYAVQLVSEEFGKINLNDLLEFLTQHAGVNLSELHTAMTLKMIGEQINIEKKD